MNDNRVYTEFYSPFVHIPGRYEWCRIHNADYGSFDMFIIIHAGTDQPVTVYVNSELGKQYMDDRYPESTTYVIKPGDLSIDVEKDTRAIIGTLRSRRLPIRSVSMRFVPAANAPIRERRYGGDAFRVWGSNWSCSGVDLEIDAVVTGSFVQDDGEEVFHDTPGIITLGSYGHIRPFDTARNA